MFVNYMYQEMPFYDDSSLIKTLVNFMTVRYNPSLISYNKVHHLLVTIVIWSYSYPYILRCYSIQQTLPFWRQHVRKIVFQITNSHFTSLFIEILSTIVCCLPILLADIPLWISLLFYLYLVYVPPI